MISGPSQISSILVTESLRNWRLSLQTMTKRIRARACNEEAAN
jgi:hypothetical protein